MRHRKKVSSYNAQYVKIVYAFLKSQFNFVCKKFWYITRRQRIIHATSPPLFEMKEMLIKMKRKTLFHRRISFANGRCKRKRGYQSYKKKS